jgi:hypothetical protein
MSMICWILGLSSAQIGAAGDTVVRKRRGKREPASAPSGAVDVAATQSFGRFLDMQDLARLQAHVNYREMSRLGVCRWGPAPSPNTRTSCGASTAR